MYGTSSMSWYTPNCNNVVIEKAKSKKQKAKSQIGIN